MFCVIGNYCYETELYFDMNVLISFEWIIQNCCEVVVGERSDYHKKLE